MKILRFSLLFFIVAGMAKPLFAEAAAEPAPRERTRIDFGWKFHLGNEWGIGQNLAKSGTGQGPASVSFSDASWRRVDLPHDWAVELPFDPSADGAHGFKALGVKFPENSVSWYRRTFTLPAADAGKRLWLEFDGVYRDCTVFVNGWAMAHQESGYMGFRVDVTDVATYGGTNVVAVRVDASQTEGWFYEGAGIYRHVWLVKTGPIALAPDSVFVYSTFAHSATEGAAQLHFQGRVKSHQKDPALGTIRWTVETAEGAAVGSAQDDIQLAGEGEVSADQVLQIDQPALWSPESPVLYRLITTVAVEGKIVDRKETNFGVRTFAFDAEKGFILNGKPYVIKGVCNHQDHAGVGSAIPDALQDFRVAKLKEMGVNAYRTAHNPPTPELLDACDRLGLLVMDENRLLGSDAQHLKWFEQLIRRDRNHASVAIWSLANEEFTTQSTPAGGRVAATMQQRARQLDPTRPVTYNAPVGNEYDGINAVIEVRGWSYHIGAKNMDAYHAEHPQQPNVGSEQGSTVATRGIYFTDTKRGYVTAYDDNRQPWSNTAEEWWSFFDARPWLSGGFIWTGFDYRGEPTPYGWPCINSHFGILDMCGFPKDNFWYYQSWWTDRPVLHLLPHWNWAGREGQEMDVRALSNCEEVEVFLNGRSLGRQTMKRDSQLKWKVPYAPGVLSAQGFRQGKVIAETRVETTGEPSGIKLISDRNAIAADGRDLSVVSVAIVDEQQRVVPTAGNHLAFALEGPGRIIGVGNGDPSSHEPDVFFSEIPLQRSEVGDWRWSPIADVYAASLPETAPEFVDSAWTHFDAERESGPLPLNGSGVFRAHFKVTSEQMAAPAIELWFGKLEGDAKIYLNGVNLGAGGDAGSSTILEVKHLLKVGDNVLAIPIKTYGATGGVNKGVALRLIGKPPALAWSRSAFNGYAQVLVQSSGAPGTIKLTVRAEGLKPATIAVAATQPGGVHGESSPSVLEP